MKNQSSIINVFGFISLSMSSTWMSDTLSSFFYWCSAVFSVPRFTYFLRFNFLSVWLAKCTLPNENIAVTTSCCKEVTFLCKCYWIYFSCMSVHCIRQQAFLQVPYLNFKQKNTFISFPDTDTMKLPSGWTAMLLTDP